MPGWIELAAFRVIIDDNDKHVISNFLDTINMLRALIYGLAILHLGPGLAFAVVAFVCDGIEPLFDSVCQQDTFGAFIKLTLMAWGAMVTGVLLKIYIERLIRKTW